MEKTRPAPVSQPQGVGTASAWVRDMGSPALLQVLSSMVLAARFPMFLLWGPKRRLLYNEAYRPILGTRHPAAMGRPFADVWPEVADEIGPLIGDGPAEHPSLRMSQDHRRADLLKKGDKRRID